MFLKILTWYVLLCFARFYILGLPTADSQYGAILDAGSTSTKTHLYRWIKTKENLPNVVEIYYKKHKPEVSSFVDHMEGIPIYLAHILADLQLAIPENKSLEVYFMATAGLRLLGETKAQLILNEVKSVFENETINPFHIPTKNVQILSGEDEALFSWIAINYMSRTFQNNENTFGLIEIGGGSTQLAFVPDVPIFAGKTVVHIGNHIHNVYTHSYLSYGSTAMKKRIRMFLLRENPHATAVTEPCMLKGDNSKIVIKGKELQLTGGGNASQCQDIISHFLTKVPESFCSPKPCSIGSVYTPSIPQNSEFIGLGSIYNTAKELHMINESGHLDPQKLKEESIKYCSKTLLEADDQYGIPATWASSDCQNGLYIPMFLDALGFDIDYQILTLKYINGNTVAWSLGAMVYEIENNDDNEEKE